MHDLIDRQAAIDALLTVTGNSSVRELYEHVQEHDLSDMWSGGVNAAIDVIIAQPTIEPERKKGHWIRHPEQRNIFNGKTIECSECHEKYTVQYVEDELFCRHCGADMRGEE